MLVLTGCSNKTVDSLSDAEGKVDDNAFESTESTTADLSVGQTETNSADTSTETEPEVEETQSVGKAIIATSSDNGQSAETRIEILDTDKGSWLKTPSGYRLKLKDSGEFMESSVLEVQEHFYYFDSDGYLQPNTIVKADGKKWILQNCLKVTGFTDLKGFTYYVDADKGVLTLCSAKIEGSVYWFDKDGKSISEEDFKKLSEE